VPDLDHEPARPGEPGMCQVVDRYLGPDKSQARQTPRVSNLGWSKVAW
jgi:hypothetical protein